MSKKMKFVEGEYTVFFESRTGRYSLYKFGEEIAWKWKCESATDLDKWIKSWEKNARKQIERLGYRMDELSETRDNFRRLLGEEK